MAFAFFVKSQDKFICCLEHTGLSKSKDKALANAKLIAAAPDFYEVSRFLAELFPEDDMAKMDVADFTDRACKTMGIVLKAKQAIEKAK